MKIFSEINRKTSRLILFLYSLFSMNSLFAQSIQTDAEQHHSDWQQPSEGVVMAYHADNTTRYGLAGLTKQDGFKPDQNTIFEIGSITKVFTSILLAEAVRENLAKFDDPVSTHLADLKFEKGSPFQSITLSQLATHTSGLPRIPVDLFDGANNENPYIHYDEQRLTQGLVEFREKQLENPGKYSYSNYGAGILGYVLTQIYGHNYRDLLKEKIFDPLNMTSTDVPTRFTDLPDELTERIATPHSGGKAVSHWEFGSLVGAGAMISSAEDLIKFGLAHWDDTIQQGLASSLAEVAKPRMEGQGLGWVIDGDNLFHNGGTGGSSTDITVNTRAKSVRVFLANSSAGKGPEKIMQGDLQSLEGYWSGYINGKEGLFVYLKVIKSYERPVLELYTPDQHDQAISVSSASLKNGEFRFESNEVNGTYSGKLSEGKESIKGYWKQGLLPTSVTLHFSEEKPKRE